MNADRQSPLVSVIIPVFNSEKFLRQTLESVFAQTWENKEIIVVDDGSTDGSSQLLNDISNNQLKVIRQANAGASKARQAGLDIAKGDFIQYLDADDILDAQKIERQLIQLLQFPGKIAICKTAHFFDDKNYLDVNIPEDDTFFKAYLDEPINFLLKLYGAFDLKGGMIQTNAFLTPRTVVDAAGPWGFQNTRCPDDDGEYFCRIILNSKGIIYTPEVRNYYRKFLASKSLSNLRSEIAFENMFKSTMLKHKHLLRSCNNEQLIPFIHTATYRSLNELRFNVYPHYLELSQKIECALKSLTPNQIPKNNVFGGRISNFIGNKISWRLLRELQDLINR